MRQGPTIKESEFYGLARSPLGSISVGALPGGLRPSPPKIASSLPQGWPTYGALELKRGYQRGLSLGIVFAVIAHIGSVEGWVLYRYLQTDAEPVVVREIVLRSLSDLAAPPSITASKPQLKIVEPGVTPPSIGIPVPVPDEEVIEPVQFATREDLAQLSVPALATESSALTGGDSVVFTLSAEEYFPSPDEFVAVQEYPALVKETKPAYPEIALLTGREGVVWIKALVDQAGKVREARVAKSSESSVGFDEAAVEAAYKNIYKPAIQNGRPVAVWITYRVEFLVE